MDDTREPKVEKKPYIKPQLTEVRLAAQEAVLALCKDGALGTCTPDPSCTSTPRS